MQSRDHAKDASVPRWIVPLLDVIGRQEPNADDSDDWILRDVVPRGEPALLAGPPKIGKTWVALDIALAIALGKPWLHGGVTNTMGRPARVLVLALEDSPKRLGRRLWQLARGYGTTPDDPDLRENLMVSTQPIRIPGEGVAAFTDEIRRWGPALVVIDNVTRVMVGDQNATRDAAEFTRAWCQLCANLTATVLLVHHVRKATNATYQRRRGTDVLDDVRGSSDIVAAARHVLVMQPAGNDGQAVEIVTRGNLDTSRDQFVVELEQNVGESGQHTARMVDRGDPATYQESQKRDRAAAKAPRAGLNDQFRALALQLARSDGSVSGRKLATAIDRAPRTADAVLSALAADGLLVAAGRRGFVLPEAGRKAGS